MVATTNANTRLNKIYNGSELITSNGFTMVSKYMLPVLTRLRVAGFLSTTGVELVQAVHVYKHDERKPFPTYKELSEYLGKPVRTIKEGMKSVRHCGVMKISKVNEKTGKKGKNNVYDLTPLFELIEKFIEVFHIEGRKDVSIEELLEMKDEKKQAEPTTEPASEDENSAPVEEPAKKPVEEPAKKPVEEPAKKPVEEPVQEAVVCELPTAIIKVADFYNISVEGMEAVKKAYNSFGGMLDDRIFIEKIVASSGKANFVNYFNACITTAFSNNEQPKQAPVPKQFAQKPKKASQPKERTPRTEKQPDWFVPVEERKRQAELLAKKLEEAEVEPLAEVFEKIDSFDAIYAIDNYLKTIKVSPEIQAYADAKKQALNDYYAKAREGLMQKVTTPSKEELIEDLKEE